MAILDIRVLGDPVLRERTQPIAQITGELRTLAANMFETMYAAEGIGLAAPQVGRGERMFVMDVDDERFVMINPEIVSRQGSERGEEGCLSIPEIFGDVDRAESVVARAMDLDGNTVEITASGLLARCIQHELDHLDGKLFIDYLSVLKRKFVARKWEKEAAKYPTFVRHIEPRADGSRHARRSRSRDASTSTMDPPFEPEL